MAREFWILTQDGHLPPLVMHSESECQAVIDSIKRGNEPDSLHVREVVPGTMTITRADLMKLLIRNFETESNEQLQAVADDWFGLEHLAPDNATGEK